ncbi:MAG: hypothetical protein QG656_1598 [Candidatus Hydrogenedentes bacterium]|nr:hypothetical protein [Candidatus Hydrogenedentota bacterium]
MMKLMLAGLMVCGLLTCPAWGEFKAGAAVRIVTPDPLLPISGGAGTPEPADKKIGDLTVRAMVWEQGDTRVAIVGADFLGFPGVLCAKVRALVKGIPPENILIGSTHAHSAPDMYGFANEKGETGADLKYIDWVCGEMAAAINEAVENLQPASVRAATREAEGKIAYNYYAPQLYDPRMSVIQCIAKKGEKKGQPICTLVNYATHPEVIGPDQGTVCPDICGPLYDRIAEKGGGTAVFMNSAQGGMVTADCRGPNGDIQTWDECIRIGQLMADEALRIAEKATVQEDPPLFCGATTINFPLQSPLLRHVMKNSPLGYATDTESIAAQINVINLGDAQILTIPGEALPNIGYYLKRKMHGKQNLLFGLTNDALGYMLTKVDFNSFERYKYVSTTGLGEMTGEILIEEALKFVDSCPRPVKE